MNDKPLFTDEDITPPPEISPEETGAAEQAPPEWEAPEVPSPADFAQTTEIPPTAPLETALATVSHDIATTRAMVQAVVDNTALIKQLLSAIASLTNPGDWLSYGRDTRGQQKLMMSSDGAYRLAASARFLNIRWTGTPDAEGKARNDPCSYEEQEEDGTYTVIYEGIFYSNLYPSGLKVEGRCNSRNKFFRQGFEADGVTPAFRIPLKCEVREKALANLVMRGVARVSCLWHPTEELLTQAGLNLESIQEIEFKSGAKGGNVAADAVKTDNLTAAKVALETLVSLTGEAPSAIVNRLSAYTKDGKTYGYPKLEMLKFDWQVSKVLKALQAEIENVKKTGAK